MLPLVPNHRLTYGTPFVFFLPGALNKTLLLHSIGYWFLPLSDDSSRDNNKKKVKNEFCFLKKDEAENADLQHTMFPTSSRGRSLITQLTLSAVRRSNALSEYEVVIYAVRWYAVCYIDCWCIVFQRRSTAAWQPREIRSTIEISWNVFFPFLRFGCPAREREQNARGFEFHRKFPPSFSLCFHLFTSVPFSISSFLPSTVPLRKRT